MQRACDSCRDPYEAKTARSRFCSTACRMAASRARAAGSGSSEPVDLPPPPTPAVGAKLAAEFQQLGVADTYEAGMALWLAGQLDSGTITGTAGVSMSKELDRRVDILRLRAELPHDPAREIRERLEGKRLRLVEGAG